MPITEGKIDGNDISFLVVQKGADHDFKMTYAGQVNGNEMKLTLKFPIGRSVEMIAKKVS